VLLLLAILAYSLGSLPLGYWLLVFIFHKDPRTASAYHLGLESSARLLGIGPLLLTALLDFLKGHLGAWLGHSFGLEGALLTGVFTYLGHLYPPRQFFGRHPLRGRGGFLLLGLVSGLSVSGLPYLLALIPFVVAFTVYALSGYASLAGLSVPLSLALILSAHPWPLSAKLLAWLLALLAIWRYKEHLGRILEGIEPRLGDPLPLPSTNQVTCAFMIHPLTLDDLWQSPRFRWFKIFVDRGLIAPRLIERIAEWVRPMKVGELRGVQTADGREIRCYLISAPLLPHQIVQQPKLATLRAIQGARLARELQASVIGLGAFWSVVGEKGRVVQEAVPEIQVTNGGAYTAGTIRNALPRLLERASREGKNLRELTAAVVGANGVVAFGIARQIAPWVGRLILVGRDLERLRRSAETLRSNLERKGNCPELVVSTQIEAVREADLIFSATSDPNPVLYPEHIKPGAWIYDEGVPPDVHPSVYQVPGVRVIPGGVVRPPGNLQGNLDLHFGPGAVPACLAETMILAAERAFERKSLGGETKLENIQYFVEQAELLGFRPLEEAEGLKA
jgi:predicted amino acid dehydrogenase